MKSNCPLILFGALFACLVLSVETKGQGIPEGMGIVGRYFEDEYPIIVVFDGDLPNSVFRKERPWLCSIRWDYPKEENNGLPINRLLETMYDLERVFDGQVGGKSDFYWAYNRTGNGYREWLYYATRQGAFTQELNEALKDHPRYPIKLTFYSDPTWSDYADLIEDFK